MATDTQIKTLRASEMCPRRAYLYMNGDGKGDETILDRDLWRMAQGTTAEAAVVDYLRATRDMSILRHDPDVHLDWSSPSKPDIVFRGHPDAWDISADPGGIAPVMEVKTTSDAKFTAVAREAVRWNDTMTTSNDTLARYISQMRRYCALAIASEFAIVDTGYRQWQPDPYWGILAVAGRESKAPEVFRLRLFGEWDDHAAFLTGEIDRATPEGANYPPIPEGFKPFSVPCNSCEFKSTICFKSREFVGAEGGEALARDYFHATRNRDIALAQMKVIREKVGDELRRTGLKRLPIEADVEYTDGDKVITKTARYYGTLTNPKTGRKSYEYEKMVEDGVADKYVKVGAVPDPEVRINTVKEKSNAKTD